MAKADAAVSEGFLLEIEEIIKPDIRFDDVFKEYLSVSLFEKIQSFTRPNRRYIHKNIYLPGYERPKEHLTLYIAIDSSMSVGDEEYRRFLGAASSVAQSFSEYTITVVPFDSKINSSLVFRLTSGELFSEEAFKIPKTDGGTDIEPFFEYAENDPEFGADSVLAVLTDGFFEMPLLNLKHEITEMSLIELPDELKNFSITIMDGPFFSIMPFPSRNLNTFSHVRYTPHGSWIDKDEYHNGYEILKDYEKKSNFRYMINDAKRYIPLLENAVYKDSIYEVKTVQVKNETDDGRPILFTKDYEIKNFSNIMGGKIDNIYEILDTIKETKEFLGIKKRNFWNIFS